MRSFPQLIAQVPQVLSVDYGFRSGFGRLYQADDGEIPANLFQLVCHAHKLCSCNLWHSSGLMEQAFTAS